MTTWAAMEARLDSFASQETTGSADLTAALRDVNRSVNADVTNAAVEINIINNVKFVSRIVSASFVPETGVAANAASLDAEIFFDDGASGGATSLCDMWDGTASSSTSSEREDFANPVVGVDIPVGSRIYVAITVNAGGDVWDDTAFEVEIRRN